MSSIMARAATVTAVAAAVALTLTAIPAISSASSATSGTSTASTANAHTNSAHRRPAGDPLTMPRNRNLLIIGASYTAGWGATAARLDYAHRVAGALDWPTTITAEPGAGYVSTGNNGHDDFTEQIDALPADLRPGLVLIQGGRDDDGEPAAREYAAGIRTINLLRAKFHDPEIVMLGDIPANLPVPQSAVETSSTLQQVANAEHVPFVNPISQHWMTCSNLPGFHSDVPGHPNDAGHEYIAYRLVHSIEQLSGQTITPAQAPIA